MWPDFFWCVMAGWVPVPADGWALDRQDIEGRWPMSLVVLDLRFWDDAKACNSRPRPSSRALAKAWGWSPAAALRMVNNSDRWADHERRKREAAVKQQRSSGEAVDHGPMPNIRSWRSSGEAVVKQQRSSGEAALKETRARTPHPTPPNTLLSSPSSKKRAVKKAGPVEGFEQLAQTWADEAASARGDKRTRAPKWSSNGEPTKGLKRLLKDGHDVDDIAALFRWHWHGPDDARNREKGRGIMTLARHADRYIVQAIDWRDGKRSGGPMPAHPDDAPRRSGAGSGDLQRALDYFAKQKQQGDTDANA